MELIIEFFPIGFAISMVLATLRTHHPAQALCRGIKYFLLISTGIAGINIIVYWINS